jgi:hypothetical protein
MSEHAREVGTALEHIVPPIASVAGDWEAVLRDSRRGRTPLLALTIATLVVVFGVAPGLGLGRDVLWLGLYDEPASLIELASGTSYSVGPWRIGVTGGGGGGIALDLVYGGERKVVAGGVDAGLPGGATPGERHWVGYVTFFADAQFAFGPAAARVDRVDVVLTDGERIRAEIVSAPPEIRTPLRFYVAEIPVTLRVHSIVAYDESGTILDERMLPEARKTYRP